MSWIVRVIFFALIVTANANANAKSIEENLRDFSEQLSLGEEVQIDGEYVHTKSIMPLIYLENNYAPMWTNIKLVEDVLVRLRDSELEGLYREDYHYSTLIQLLSDIQRKKGDLNFEKAQFDILLSDGVMLYAFHLLNGKVDPSAIESSWNYARQELLPEVIINRITTHTEKGDVLDVLDSYRPDAALYTKFEKGLGEYVRLAENKEFKELPTTTLLRPGMTSEVVSLLRQRLQDENYDITETAEPNLYDEELKQAMMEFQRLHGITADGVVGPQSFQELNVSFADRADQIRINLERTRWVIQDVSDEFVLVNIAGYQLYYFRKGEVEWQTEVMIGTEQHETPVFKSSIRYLVFNPTWTVPRSILRKSLINKMKADPSYLDKQDFALVDRDGKTVDLSTLNWDELSVNNFPYTAVQQPGIHNALGQVKFMFPNQYAVYLHDTPSKSLFSQTHRAFSYGCVRVQHPFEFAKHLLNDEENWNDQTIQDVLNEKTLRNVSLAKPVDVLLMYWTAEPDDETGRIKFNQDVYSRDAALKSKLKASLR